ncbi:hypothetical protein LCGC14_1166820 [marine sediment metagenome]|uniref:Uncharacterized protein n=1 Tax=marine sediment metagenome TaxID=412755 RepID=A0A0F9LR44_9ZZZZ
MKIKRIKSSSFLGKQLSRLRMGQSYYTIITSTISAIALVSLAFHINIWITILTFPLLLVITFAIGYYLDIRNVRSIDSLKSIEMTQRFLNKGDLKSQEFQIMQTAIIIEAIRKGKDFDPKILWERYEEYKKKWKSPQI